MALPYFDCLADVSKLALSREPTQSHQEPLNKQSDISECLGWEITSAALSFGDRCSSSRRRNPQSLVLHLRCINVVFLQLILDLAAANVIEMDQNRFRCWTGTKKCVCGLVIKILLQRQREYNAIFLFFCL